MALASENYFDGIPKLAALYGVSPLQLIQLDPGYGWEAILSGEPIEVRSAVGRGGRSRSSFCRICGQCFASDEKPYHRAEWDLPLSLVCRIHSTLLLDTCSACGKPIDYLRVEVTRCSCGVPFSATGKAAPPWLTIMVKSFIDPDDTSRQTRFALPSDDEMRAGRVLIRIADHQAGRATLCASGKRVGVPMVRQEHLEDLRPWFEKGPTSFLARMRELGGEEEGWMRYRISLKLYRFPRLSGVLSSAIKEKPLRIRRAARPDEDRATEFYRANDLRQTFGVGHQTIAYWVSVGIIPLAACPSGQRSRISSSVFEAIRKRYETSCSQDEASSRLGCTKSVVRKLMHLGVIRRARLMLTLSHDRVDLKSLNGLRRYFLCRAKPGSLQEHCFSFEELVMSINGPEQWSAFRSLAGREAGVFPAGLGKQNVGDLRFPVAPPPQERPPAASRRRRGWIGGGAQASSKASLLSE